jgi:hypothetical protein
LLLSKWANYNKFYFLLILTLIFKLNQQLVPYLWPAWVKFVCFTVTSWFARSVMWPESLGQGQADIVYKITLWRMGWFLLFVLVDANTGFYTRGAPTYNTMRVHYTAINRNRIRRGCTLLEKDKISTTDRRKMLNKTMLLPFQWFTSSSV